jgi:hypothetical protein
MVGIECSATWGTRTGQWRK